VSEQRVSTDEVHVRGNASAEELAVVLAVLRRDSPPAAPQRGHDEQGYARWRAVRLAALRGRR
jgi:hypothetical protein